MKTVFMTPVSLSSAISVLPIKNFVFWEVTPGSLEEHYIQFGESY
jgi:hypothetical protein